MPDFILRPYALQEKGFTVGLFLIVDLALVIYSGGSPVGIGDSTAVLTPPHVDCGRTRVQAFHESIPPSDGHRCVEAPMPLFFPVCAFTDRGGDPTYTQFNKCAKT